MEKDVKLGSVGDLDLQLVGGKAVVTVKAEVPEAALSVSASVTMDGGLLIDALKAAIEKKYPASAPIDEAVFGILKAAVSAL